MTYPNTLDLSSIVSMTVSVSPGAAAAPSYNEMLIIGPSTLIPVATRVYEFASVEEMLTYGFLTTDVEYEAAVLYFGQTPKPASLWVGRVDKTTSPDETFLEAVQACRTASREWYIVSVVDPAITDADHLAIAAYVETATVKTVYAYTTSDAQVLEADPSPEDICTSLKALSYKRTIGQYSSQDAKAICAIMGYACGQNTGLASSAFTLKFKQEVGVATDDIDSGTLAIVEGKNCNIYVNYNDYYNFFEQGKMANGWFFDRVINLDMLCSDIQYNIANLLYSTAKVPQTESGMLQIINAINDACESAYNTGYIGAGTWRGSTVLTLEDDDILPRGYVVLAEKLADQSDADRALRKAPNIYVCIIEAGAIHSLVLQVVVSV